MIEMYINKDMRTVVILMVLGFMVGLFMGYMTGTVKVKEYNFKDNYTAPIDSNSLQDKPLQKLN